jgi:hypothetical protein
VLYLFLAAHGCTSIEKSYCAALEKAVLDANPLVIPPSQVPAIMSKWSVLESLDPIPGEDWLNDYWSSICSLAVIGCSDMNRFLPNGNENTQTRAQLLL